MKKLKVGLVGLVQANFRGDKAAVYKRSIEKMDELSKKLDFEFYATEKFVLTADDAQAAKKEMEDKKVDFLLIQSTSFASGFLIEILAKTKAYIGLWAVPEPTSDGKLLLNSFCGMNMNASIIVEYLREYNIPFKWFYGYTEHELFINRFKVTVKALHAIINLKGSKVGLVGGIAPGFDDFYYDERHIEKKLGVTVNRLLEFDNIKSKVLSYTCNDVKDEMELIRSDATNISQLADNVMVKNASVIKALKEIKEENGLDALAVSCWPKSRVELGMVFCAAIGRLNEMGIVTGCEGDVLSTISMLTMKYLTGADSMLLDCSNIDFKDDSILLWHCGVGSKCYANKGKIDLEDHFNPGPYTPEHGWSIKAPVASMIFKPQPATVMRFTHDADSMLLLSGEFRDPNKPGFDGSRGWYGNLKLNGEKINIKDFINTILVNGFQHHYPVVGGDNTEEMLEFASWLDIKPIEKKPYTNYL